VADHVAIAGLMVDFSGAVLLARALAFEGADEYVRSSGTTRWAGAGGTDVYRDFERAEDGAEAVIGAAQLGAGFLGQLIGAVQSDWSETAAVIAYTVAVIVIGAGWAALPRLRRRRERDIFFAHLDAADRHHVEDPNSGAIAKERFDIYGLYLGAFTQTDRPTSRLDGWVAEWERRHGRHPGTTSWALATRRSPQPGSRARAHHGITNLCAR
jgi:hypothetical protein